MCQREQLYNMIDQMENIITNIRKAINIIEININIFILLSLLENNTNFIEADDSKKEIKEKVIEIITAINQNENTRFDVTHQNKNDAEAASRVVENTKTILKIIN